MSNLELRRAVAVEVFGLEGLRFKTYRPDSLCAYPGSKLPKEWPSSRVPAYETDIAEAWLVQEKMQADEELEDLYFEALVELCKPTMRLNHVPSYQRQINRALIYATPTLRCKAALAAVRSQK